MSTIKTPPGAIKILKSIQVWEGDFLTGYWISTWEYYYSAVPNVSINPAMPMYRICKIQTTLTVGDVYGYVAYKVAPYPMNTVYSDPLNIMESDTIGTYDGAQHVYFGVR